MKKVAIVLSAYNGQTYISEQIDSILAQDYTDFELFIRDDGSQDHTTSIINKYCQQDARIHNLVDAEGQPNSNLGFGNSFSTALRSALLSNTDFDYFAFCDQDDYWEPGKLSAAVSHLQSTPADIPLLYASNYYICDSQLSINRICNDSNPMDGVTFHNMFFEGVFPGFTIVINRELALLGFGGDTAADIYYHDKWVSLIAMGCGGQIIYDNTPHARYRRHESAASSTDLGAIAKLRWRIDNVLNGSFCPRTHQMLVEFHSRFYNSCSQDIGKFLDTFTSSHTVAKLFYPHRLRRSFSGEILLRIILLLGKL